MSVPQYYELHRPILEIMEDGHMRTLHELRHLLAERFQLTPEQRADMLPSGRQAVFSNRVSWANTYLYKAGLLERPKRATYVITDAGRMS